MERIRRSWELAKASLDVLRKDKELMIFPIISALAMVVVSAVFLVPSLLSNFIDNMLGADAPVLGYVVLFLFYIVQYTVVYFFNTALIGAALIRLRGGNPTVSDGFKVAMSRLGPIVGWALVSATVGLLLNVISDKSKKNGRGIGQIVSSLLGAAWNIVTFLVVPVLAAEGLGPIEAIKRSWALLKRSWGEQISGTITIGLVFGLVGMIGGLLLVGAGVGLSIWLESWVPGLLFGIVLVLFIMFMGLLNSTLSGIFAAAVYTYAVDGESSLFDEQLLSGAVL
jgi:hypothetical protein